MADFWKLQCSTISALERRQRAVRTSWVNSHEISHSPISGPTMGALILAGLILRADAVLYLPLIPIFIWVIEQRFILGEEARMRVEFRQKFACYEQKVRRWI